VYKQKTGLWVILSFTLYTCCRTGAKDKDSVDVEITTMTLNESEDSRWWCLRCCAAAAPTLNDLPPNVANALFFPVFKKHLKLTCPISQWRRQDLLRGGAKL